MDCSIVLQNVPLSINVQTTQAPAALTKGRPALFLGLEDQWVNRRKCPITSQYKCRLGVPLWCSRLRIWHCHRSGLGSVPGPGTSTCCRCGQEKEKKKCYQHSSQTPIFKIIFLFLIYFPNVFNAYILPLIRKKYSSLHFGKL